MRCQSHAEVITQLCVQWIEWNHPHMLSREKLWLFSLMSSFANAHIAVDEYLDDDADRFKWFGELRGPAWPNPRRY